MLACPAFAKRLISIHALRKESDVRLCLVVTVLPLFQSTLSVRRATGFNQSAEDLESISIHALRKESDVAVAVAVIAYKDFNPRSP